METAWFVLLVSAICLEGLGRKYLPQVPSIVFYLAKDVVLLAGYWRFRTTVTVQRAISILFRGFGLVWLAAVVWTALEVFNPDHQSLVLAGLGLRSYWLWWIAPGVVATVLRRKAQKRRAIAVLAYLTLSIAALAAVQFVSPTDSAVNVYAVIDGEEVNAANSGIVYSTGRARVSSTFTFLSGFQDFTLLIPALLLSLGLEATEPRLRRVALVATLVAAAVLPMSGSRASLIFGISILFLTTWSAGLFFTAIGRRIMIGAIAGAILATVAFPEAILGVQDRFDTEETKVRVIQTAAVLPPVALATLDYPFFGVGTGMQQNARYQLKVSSPYETEVEPHRYLVELGAIGFVLMWVTRLGVFIGLMRAYRILQSAGRKATAGAALSYAAMTFFGSLTFDHIWQSLFFVGCGFIIAETISVLEQRAAEIQAAAQEADSPSPAPVAAALPSRG